MSTALINRSIATLKTELEFLRDSGVITQAFYDSVAGKLPEKYQGEAAIDVAPTSINTPTVPEELVEAIYDYSPQQPEDLGFRAGDKVKVLEHTSADWWKGTSNGQTGMFPSNYVKPLGQYYQQTANQSEQQYYQQNVVIPFQQPPQQVVQQPQQEVQQQHHHNGSEQIKKFGSKLGNAAIFGAGASIGSNIVNSIF